MTRSLIALGSNVGASPSLFHDALKDLETHGLMLEQMSSCHDTTPIGAAADGDRFLNAAAIVSSTHTPAQILEALQSVEHSFGRKRDVRWGSRTLDLDLLLHGDSVVDEPKLLVPHPALWYRRFVLSSAVEIAGSWNHPLLGESLQTLWQRLQERPVRLLVDETNLSFNLKDDVRQLDMPLEDGMALVELYSRIRRSDVSLLFGIVRLFPSTNEQPRLSHRHPRIGMREIPLFVDGPDDAHQQIAMLVGAILG